MADRTRTVGLSLGADICWPAAYEALIKNLDLALPVGEDVVRFAVERVTVEPFDLAYRPRYDIVLDRLTHWFFTSREWVKKITLMDGVYVLNNPWSIQANEKHTSYCAMMRLGLPIPQTWLIPPKEYKDEGDTRYTIEHYNKLFSLGQVGQVIGYPAFLKPYDGGGWVGVTRVTDEASLHTAYDRSGTRVHHLQAAVKDWDLFVRALGVGPQVNIIKYDPDAPLHARYVVAQNPLADEQHRRAVRTCRTINAFFGWDFNSCEMLRSAGVLYPIDFANACPDSQVTSLHFHFPWLVKALLRWSIYCAATQRKMRLTLQWDRFFEAHDPDATLDENLAAYDLIAAEHFEQDRFDEFCHTHLTHLDEVAASYFSSAPFKDVVRAKVSALYPAHEIESFTDHFYGLVQQWCASERDRTSR